MCIFANGCFWGSEKGIKGCGRRHLQHGRRIRRGLHPNPTYEEACSGLTGTPAAVQVVLDPTKTLRDILRWFWECTTPLRAWVRQRPRHAVPLGVYYVDDEQKAPSRRPRWPTSRHSRNDTTEVAAASDYPQCFYYAEDYQQYLAARREALLPAQPRQVSLPP